MYKRMFGERIKKLREEDGISKDKMAELLNTTELEIYYLENGYKEPTLKQIIRLAEIFNVTVGHVVVSKIHKTERQKLIEELMNM